MIEASPRVDSRSVDEQVVESLRVELARRLGLDVRLIKPCVARIPPQDQGTRDTICHVLAVEYVKAGARPDLVASELGKYAERCVQPPYADHPFTERDASATLKSVLGRKEREGLRGYGCYLGRTIWNKFEWRKDPDGRVGSLSGRARRVPIMRPREEWVIAEDSALRIISDELWQTAKDAQSRRSSKRRRNGGHPVDGRSRYLLSGLLRCGICGANMAMRSRHGYGCMTRANRGADLCENSGVVNRRALEAVVLAAVREELYSRELVGKLTQLVKQALVKLSKQDPGGRQAEGLQREIAAKQAEIDRVTASIRRCEAQGRANAAEHLEAELDALLGTKKALEAQRVPADQGLRERILEALPRLPDMVRDHVDRLCGLLQGKEFEQVKSGLAAVVDQIEIKPGRTNDGRPCHYVRVRGLHQALRLLAGTRQTSLVAGAGLAQAHETAPARREHRIGVSVP